jgi:hypothetical protein
MPELYQDRNGKTFRPAGRCPYSELVTGSPFAFDGDPAIYVRGYGQGMPPSEPLAEIYHQMVTLLEPATTDEK